MPEAYEVHDGQFVQLAQYTSAANALIVSAVVVPAGKIWTILSASCVASVAETQDVWWSCWRNNLYTILTNPASRTMDGSINRQAAFVTEGMELKLFPGEGLSAHRAVATAGSTFSLTIRFIENDMPYYVELDKHKVLRRRKSQVSPWIANFLRGRAAAGGGPSSMGFPTSTPGRGPLEK